MTTTEGNKLIGEFMGAYQVDGWYDGYELHKLGFPFSYGAMGNGRRELPFDKDWNWLMLAVDKCYNVDDVDEDLNLIGDITHALVDVNIKEVFNAVIEFINWYNTTKL